MTEFEHKLLEKLDGIGVVMVGLCTELRALRQTYAELKGFEEDPDEVEGDIVSMSWNDLVQFRLKDAASKLNIK